MEFQIKKILLLSTGDVNGAYEAIYKLAKMFHKQGHQVALLVKSKTKNDDFIKVYSRSSSNNKEGLIIKILRKVVNKINKSKIQTKVVYNKEYDFISTDEKTINCNPSEIIKIIGFTPEIVYTGMTNGFLNSSDLLSIQQFSNAQIYNITVDMNHFTGGCHYAWNCTGYINGCTSNCPAIESTIGKEIPEENFKLKIKNAQLGKFKIIAGSGWTLKQAKDSKIYSNQKVIYNVNSLIDIDLFNSKNKDIAKRIFNLDDSKFYILMGCQSALSTRKGFIHLVNALNIFYQKCNEVDKNKIKVLLVSRDLNDAFEEILFDKEYIEYINDYRLLSLLYQAADVFVNSSIEDAGPMMVSEALACGTPVVGFDMGVVNNLVENNYNGYKAKLKDDFDLAHGINIIYKLEKKEYLNYSNNAHLSVKENSSLEFSKKIFDKIHNNEL